MAATNSTDLLTSASTSIQQVKSKLIDFATNYGMQVIGAIIILVIGFIFARWIGNLLGRWLEKHHIEPPVRNLLVRIARLVVMAFTLVMVLDKFGVPVTTLIAGIGVAGVGAGLAMQGVLSNVVAGLTIIFTKPFRVGEYIEIVSVQGEVKSIELFSTTLLHTDMSRVVIPNRKIVGEILHNYGRIRQLELTVGVAYDSDVPRVVALLQEIVAANTKVLKTPTPAVGVNGLADCSIEIAVKPWVSVVDYVSTGAEIYQTILDTFQREKIEMPFPQCEVRMLTT